MFLHSVHARILQHLEHANGGACVDELSCVARRDVGEIPEACHRLRRLGLIQLEAAPVFDLRARQIRAAIWSISDAGRKTLADLVDARAGFDARSSHPTAALGALGSAS